MGRPKKTQGRGKKNLRLSSVKKGREGSIKWKKRAGKLNARARMMASLTPPSLPDDEPSTISEKDIRSAIAVIFKREYLGANLGEWASISLSVSKQLKCGPRLVLRVLAKIEEGSPAEARRDGGGRKSRIQPGTAQADALVGSLRKGFGIRNAAQFINELGVLPGDKPIHKATVCRIAKQQFGLVCSKRQTTKTGSRNAESAWAVARLAICMQFFADLLARRSELEGTLFVDEHSEFCTLGIDGHHGQASHFEWRMPMKDGKYSPEEDGGVLEPPTLMRKAKNPQRADGIFGVCAPTPLGGRRREGRRMAPFRYRGKVVGMTAYEKGLKAEIERVRQMGLENRKKREDPDKRSNKGVWLDHCDDDNPYESRFGDDWTDHLPTSFKLTSIQGLVDHVIQEGNRLFADTRWKDSWKIYHDALPQWWERKTQEYIEERGFKDRQWRANSDTDLLIASHYKGKLMGDSPELMPLDSSLFSDQIEKVAGLVVSTASLPNDEKYSMATPDKAWRTMVDAWTQVPEHRIVQDIDRFGLALGAIITAKGAYVSDCDLRNGHRRLMRRLVRGGATVQGTYGVTTAERLRKGLELVKASWAGLTAKQ